MLSFVQFIYTIFLVATLLLGISLYTKRHHKSVLLLSLISLTIFFWSLIPYITSFIENPTQLWIDMSIIWISILSSVYVLLFFLFVLYYTGNDEYLSTELYILLSFDIILNAVFASYDPTGLFISDVRVRQDSIGIIAEYGPVFWISFIFSISLFIVSFILLSNFIISARHNLYEGQIVSLTSGLFILFLSGFVTVLEISSIDLIPVGGFFSALFFGYASLKYDFGDIIPMGRRNILDSIRDGMIIIQNDTIIDCNDQMKNIIGENPNNIIGSKYVEVFKSNPEILNILDKKINNYDEEKDTNSIITINNIHLKIVANKISGRNRFGWTIIFQNITEEKEKEKQLERQVDQLDKFSKILTHDLRNPLSISKGYVDNIKRKGEVEHIDKIDNSLDRMNETIDDVLKIVDSGSASTDIQTVRISTVFNEAKACVKTELAELSVKNDSIIYADKNNLKRLFENLIKNSIDHGLTEERKDKIKREKEKPLQITVSFDANDSNSGCLYYCDDGKGIPDEEKDLVMNENYTTSEAGHGLGLMIVEHISISHGWEVDIIDNKSGGTKFVFSNIRIPS